MTAAEHPMTGHSAPSPSAWRLHAPARTARDLVAVVYRRAGLIAACALAGIAVSLLLDLRQPHAHPATPKAWVAGDAGAMQPPGAGRVGGAPVVAAGGLKLDLDPDGAVTGSVTSPGTAALAPPALVPPPRGDEIDLSLRLDRSEAASRVTGNAPDHPPGAPGSGGQPDVLPGLVAGLLLGLLLAALRELGGDRMRSPREAERALGLPVLGAIPTLSLKARNSYFEAPAAAPDAAPAKLA
jgi:hypothetical protein